MLKYRYTLTHNAPSFFEIYAVGCPSSDASIKQSRAVFSCNFGYSRESVTFNQNDETYTQLHKMYTRFEKQKKHKTTAKLIQAHERSNCRLTGWTQMFCLTNHYGTRLSTSFISLFVGIISSCSA